MTCLRPHTSLKVPLLSLMFLSLNLAESVCLVVCFSNLRILVSKAETSAFGNLQYEAGSPDMLIMWKTRMMAEVKKWADIHKCMSFPQESLYRLNSLCRGATITQNCF